MKPRGLVPVTLATFILNLAGPFSVEAASGLGRTFMVLITLPGHVVLWHFWKSRNWARRLVLVWSVLTLVSWLFSTPASVIQSVLWGIHAALSVLLVYW